MIRSPYTFANINFLGNCNLSCFYCLGNELAKEVEGIDNMSTPFGEFPYLGRFLDECREHGVQQLYLTGLNVDPMQYEYLREFIAFLKKEGFYVGMRTNGITLDESNMDIINSLTTCARDAVGYSRLARSHFVERHIGGAPMRNEWHWIYRNTEVPFRISHVVTAQSCLEVVEFIRWASIRKPEYIQLRKVASQRPDMLPHQEAFDFVAQRLIERAKIRGWEVKEYEAARVISWDGIIDVVLWPTVDTTANSLNYFTNGKYSNDYFVIKGYKESE